MVCIYSLLCTQIGFRFRLTSCLLLCKGCKRIVKRPITFMSCFTIIESLLGTGVNKTFCMRIFWNILVLLSHVTYLITPNNTADWRSQRGALMVELVSELESQPLGAAPAVVHRWSRAPERRSAHSFSNSSTGQHWGSRLQVRSSACVFSWFGSRRSLCFHKAIFSFVFTLTSSLVCESKNIYFKYLCTTN